MFDSLIAILSGRMVIRRWQKAAADIARHEAIISECLQKRHTFLLATTFYAWQDVKRVRAMPLPLSNANVLPLRCCILAGGLSFEFNLCTCCRPDTTCSRQSKHLRSWLLARHGTSGESILETLIDAWHCCTTTILDNRCHTRLDFVHHSASSCWCSLLMQYDLPVAAGRNQGFGNQQPFAGCIEVRFMYRRRMWRLARVRRTMAWRALSIQRRTLLGWHQVAMLQLAKRKAFAQRQVR